MIAHVVANPIHNKSKRTTLRIRVPDRQAGGLSPGPGLAAHQRGHRAAVRLRAASAHTRGRQEEAEASQVRGGQAQAAATPAPAQMALVLRQRLQLHLAAGSGEVPAQSRPRVLPGAEGLAPWCRGRWLAFRGQ